MADSLERRTGEEREGLVRARQARSRPADEAYWKYVEEAPTRSKSGGLPLAAG
jgi:hypothetical protein